MLLDLQIVGGDKEVDGIPVVLRALGEGVRPAHQAAQAGAQGAKPAFDVAGLARFLAAAAMGARREGGGIGFPEIAARGAAPVVRRQGSPQVGGALLASVAQGVSDDLAGSSTERHPQPERVRLGRHEAPEFVELEHVALLSGQQRVGKGGQPGQFFPPPSA